MSAARASLLHLKTESNEILNKISIFLYVPKTEQIHLSQMGEKNYGQFRYRYWAK